MSSISPIVFDLQHAPLSALHGSFQEKLTNRLVQVYKEIDEKGHYNLTYEELAYGARLAWRNAPRCVNRIIWRQLEVRLLSRTLINFLFLD